MSWDVVAMFPNIIDNNLGTSAVGKTPKQEKFPSIDCIQEAIEKI